MGQVDALKMVNHVRKRLVDLAVSENYLRDPIISKAVRNVWEGSGNEGGLVSELWIEGAFPGKHSCDSLKSLSEEGLFPKDLQQHLHNNDSFPGDRLLYNHQSEAIREAAKAQSKSKPSIVITAGTGLGKTEAFLLPMLSDLWLNHGRKQNGGMRCLILYPMNALVADQVDRIYRWLQGQSKLSVFHFTSETPENVKQANKMGEPKWESCRMRTREEARGYETHDGFKINEKPYGTVPDIVITNYSMLEYMLCRPQDARFFGSDLRCIILDEAHLYSGSLAAEIMMLLRRVKSRCGVLSDDILHMATSATLGGSDEDLQSFASSLFSVSQSQTVVIKGLQERPDFSDVESNTHKNVKSFDIAPYSDIKYNTFSRNDELVTNNFEDVEKLCSVLSCFVSEDHIQKVKMKIPGNPAQFLYECLKRAPLIRKVANILNDDAFSLDQLALKLFNNHTDTERNAVITLLRLSASARLRASDLPLIPHRIHFLVRAPEGLGVCLNPECTGSDDRKVPHIGCLQPYADHCRYCGHIVLPVYRCDNCGSWALKAVENEQISILIPSYYAENNKNISYYVLNKPYKGKKEIIVDTSSGEIRGFGTSGISLWEVPRDEKTSALNCPICDTKWSLQENEEQEPEWRHPIQSLSGGGSFALSVTAETILYDLPVFPGSSRFWKPAEGRRLLSFSDSRASAARLGPLLTQQHEIQVIRAAIARCVNTLETQNSSQYYKEEIARLEKRIALIKEDKTLRYALEEELKGKKTKLKQAIAGTAFDTFTAIVADRKEIRQILDRDKGEHQKPKFSQNAFNENTQAVRNHIEGLIATEINKPIKKRPSVESVGLLEVVYPGVDILSLPSLLEEKLPQSIRAKMSKVWPEIISLLLDTMRSDGCIDWSKETDKRKWLDESPLQAKWMTRSRSGWNSSTFVGKTEAQLRRDFLISILKAVGYDGDKSIELSEKMLFHAFDQLFQGALDGTLNWIRINEHHQISHEEDDQAIQILLDKLSVRKPINLYRCETTGTIWTHSVYGWVPFKGSNGTLKKISHEDLDKDFRWGRYRREYKESDIFSIGLWAEEHSAQLSPQENRRLQDLFKNGVRNVLSSTTTMELGIDIGGLNGVLLGNVPPGPANHRQRAGRAGRRSDGSAIVITYSRRSEYEREVFQRFGEFLKRELKKPTVFTDRERIIKRHLHAVLLSRFLRNIQPDRTSTMGAFGRMGPFCGINHIPDYWKKDLSTKPIWRLDGINTASQFVQFLSDLLKDDRGIFSEIAQLSNATGLELNSLKNDWYDFINKAKGAFEKAIQEWNNDIDSLKSAWNEIPERPVNNIYDERSKANSIRYMIKALTEITVIEWLADHRFLPRYGFPINLQRLSIRKAKTDENKKQVTIKSDERYRLERSSLLALKEYVPGSRVLVGGRIATSRGLSKHWTNNNLNESLGLQYFSLKCQEGHTYLSQSLMEPCPRCHTMPIKNQQLVFPRFGYTTAVWDKIPLGAKLERIGQQSVCPIAFVEQDPGEVINNYAGVPNLTLIYREEAPLLVRNSGKNELGFAICTRCGYAESESDRGDGRIELPRNFEKHASIFSTNPNSFCWEKGERSAPVLRNRVLAAKELTDMILIEWPGDNYIDPDALYSLGRALILSGAKLLELDNRELGMELIPIENNKQGIVIYDTSPGGAGHCLELKQLGREWLESSQKILYVDADHDKRCKKACLDCILDFSGQYSAHRLDRKSALDLLNDVLA
jgi:superfamily II DNA or RNA helicase